MLRTSLCKNQTSWEMKIFKPPSKMPFKRSQHSCCHGNNGCLFEAWGLFSYKNVAKKFSVDKLRFILLDSQCLRAFNRGFPLFFFFFFVLVVFTSESGNLLIYRKMSISRLLWGDRWKLHGEIQRHAIVITYMFMTNDRCEDSFVQISRLQHVLNDIQV